MLLRYIVSNFKSIGSPVEFTMLPSEQIIDVESLKQVDTKDSEWHLLRRAGLFGPNASGKSSLIRSISFARNYIVNGKKSGKGTGVDQFRGNISELNGVSTFQFTFTIDRSVYEYGFAINKFQVCEEWLMEFEKQGFVPLFTRLTSTDGKTEIEIESKFARANSKDRKLAEILKESIQEKQRNQLFLYKLSDNGIKKAEKIVDWFREIQIIFPDTKIRALPIRVKEDESLREYLGEMLKEMDTGVYDITVASDEIDFHEFAEKMDLPLELVDNIEEIKNGIVSIEGKYFVFSEDKGKQTLVQLKFEHHLNNTVVRFNMEDESDGTQRLLDLIPMIFSIGKNDALYFVDELDRSLHTKLSHFLLSEFERISKNTNSRNQIVYTAHDVNLIDLNNFRQDEIWFIEKNREGETRLRPLSDFHVTKTQDPLKAYLNGRFGAIPVIGGEC
mgnify:FL=1